MELLNIDHKRTAYLLLTAPYFTIASNRPTYPMSEGENPKKDALEYGKKRVPAWCDRKYGALRDDACSVKMYGTA